jgi:hypothetical protein
MLTNSARQTNATINSNHFPRENVMKKIPLIALMLAQTVGVATAAELSYSYVQGSLSQVDIDGESAAGLGFSASGEINEYFAIIGSYSAVASDDEFNIGGTVDEVETSAFSFGAAFHAPVSATADFVASIQQVEADREFGGQSVSSDGQSLVVGFRGVVSPTTEAFGGVQHVRSEDESETGYGVGLRVGLSNTLSGGVSYSSIDVTDTLSLFLRFNL